jgi:hypothetical protein
MTRPRAADDFAVIGARIEELRRALLPAPAEPEARPLPPRPYHTASAVTPKADPRRLPPRGPPETLSVTTTFLRHRRKMRESMNRAWLAAVGAFGLPLCY